MNLSLNLTPLTHPSVSFLQHCKSIMLCWVTPLSTQTCYIHLPKKKKKKSFFFYFIFPYLLQILLHVFPLPFMTQFLRGVIYTHYLAFLSSYSLWKPPQVSFHPSHSTNTSFLGYQGPPHSRWKGLFPILRLLELSPLTPFFTLSGDTFLKLDFSWILFSSHSQLLSHFSNQSLLVFSAGSHLPLTLKTWNSAELVLWPLIFSIRCWGVSYSTIHCFEYSIEMNTKFTSLALTFSPVYCLLNFPLKGLQGFKEKQQGTHLQTWLDRTWPAPRYHGLLFSFSVGILDSKYPNHNSWFICSPHYSLNPCLSSPPCY